MPRLRVRWRFGNLPGGSADLRDTEQKKSGITEWVWDRICSQGGELRGRTKNCSAQDAGLPQDFTGVKEFASKLILVKVGRSQD